MRVHLRPEILKSDVALEYSRMSAGFLEPAEQLNAAMVSGAWESNYFRGIPAKLLAFHSVELFLKACIARATPDKPILCHSLAELYSEFSRLYPTLSFDPLFIVEPLVPYPPWLRRSWLRIASFMKHCATRPTVREIRGQVHVDSRPTCLLKLLPSYAPTWSACRMKCSPTPSNKLQHTRGVASERADG